MSWSPERQKRYERAVARGTLGWRCLLCNGALSNKYECPHSRAQHEVAVAECRTAALVMKVTRSMETEHRVYTFETEGERLAWECDCGRSGSVSMWSAAGVDVASDRHINYDAGDRRIDVNKPHF